MSPSLQNLAELTSLALTFPTVVLAFAVIYMWLPSARDAWQKTEKSGQDWFVMGVAIGFVGAALDNIYWFLPWTAAYLGDPAFQSLTNLGVFFNIFFRQGLGICAAYCHLRASEESNAKPIKVVNSLLIASHLVGFGYVLLLTLSAS
jgi:hypothetical protein